MLVRLLLIFICGLLACSCEQKSLPPGTVASVNGETISLQSVETLLDSRSASLGISPRPSVSEMQTSYRQALAILIAHTLVRQELARRGLEVDESELNAAIDQIRADFGSESLGEFLSEASLREDEWRQLMRDHLALEVFTERLLLPSMPIVSLPEIRAYYDENKDKFTIPAGVFACFGVADDRSRLVDWCENIKNKDFSPGQETQCIDLTTDAIPEPWNNESIKAPACGRIIQQDGQWRVLAILAKNKETRLEISQVYAMIENILIEQKKQAAFERWLEKKMATSKILVNPELFALANKPASEF